MIPPDAKKAFTGKIFEVWQWEQKMYDGSTQTFERLTRPNTAQVLAVFGDKIVMLSQEQPHRPQPYTSLPGGRCEQNEEPLLCAQRELLEETGYASDDWILFQENQPAAKIEWTVFTFIARNCQAGAEPHLDSGEKITMRLLSFDELLTLPDDATFQDPSLVVELLRARYDAEAKQKLRTLLFPNA